MGSGLLLDTSALVADFRAWLERSGLGPGTVRAYCADVRSFLETVSSVEGHVRVEGLTAEAALGWVRTACESGQIKPTTARRKVTALRRFLAFLQQAGHCEGPAELHAVRLSNESALLTRFDIRKIRAVVEAPDRYSRQGRRDRAMLEVLYATGMQVKELCALRVEDWDPATMQLRIGEGRRARTVSLGPTAGAAEEYLETLEEFPPSEPLFPSRSGGHLTNRDVTRIVGKWATEAGVGPGEVTAQAIIAAARMRMINLWPDQAKDELGYSQLSVARHRYANPRLAAQAGRERDERARKAPSDKELRRAAEQAAAELGLEVAPDDAPGDSEWLAEALTRRLPAPRHGFPPACPADTFKPWDPLLADDEFDFAARLSEVGRALRPLLEAIEARRRNRRGQELVAAPGSVVALRRRLLDADQMLAAMARVADQDMEAGVDDPHVVRLVEWLLDPEAADEEVEQRAAEELDRRERAHKDHTDAALENRDPTTYPRHLPLAAGFQDLAVSSPLAALDGLERMLATGQGWEAFAWLADELWPGMRHAYRSAVAYYGVPVPERGNDASLGAMFVSLMVALVRTSPEALQRGGMGLPLEHLVVPYLERAFVEHLARNLAHAHDLPPLWQRVEWNQDTRELVSQFESEWERILPYTDGRFGFAVVPRLSVPAMCLYLRKVPRHSAGRRRAIRREVGDYLVHRALGIGEAVRAQMPAHWAERAFAIIAPLMEPLVQSQARRIVKAVPELDLDTTATGLRLQMRDIMGAYDPHRRFRNTTGRVALGAVGARRREDVARAATALGVPGEGRPLPLLSYVEKKLREHAGKEIREELELGDPESLRLPKVIGPRGEEYVTVYGAGKRLQCSVHQARRLDDVLTPRRLRDVWPRRIPEMYRHLPADTRLYPVGATPWEAGERELRSWAGRASAIPEGYATRASIAKALGVYDSNLVRWERQGHIRPTRRGRNVLYSKADCRIAAGLKEKHAVGKRR